MRAANFKTRLTACPLTALHLFIATPRRVSGSRAPIQSAQPLRRPSTLSPAEAMQSPAKAMPPSSHQAGNSSISRISCLRTSPLFLLFYSHFQLSPPQSTVHTDSNPFPPKRLDSGSQHTPVHTLTFLQLGWPHPSIAPTNWLIFVQFLPR